MALDMRELFSEETCLWFAREIGEPTETQRAAWPVLAAGESALISAPTGTGKTLSAFLVFIDRMKAQAEHLPEGVQLLYISPLKALAADIRENLNRPNQGIGGPELRVGVRTGDTPSWERQRMLKHPPQIFITTPESLYLLITTRRGREMLSSVRAVIVDELHALISTKRGAHLMLSLSRLDRLCGRRVQRIGLSATVQPLELAAEYLCPKGDARIIAPEIQKKRSISVNGPLPDMRVIPQGTIWPEIARQVFEYCAGRRTVIAFLEGRAQAERLASVVNEIARDAGIEGEFALSHHGSVSRERRQAAEEALRSGSLRLLCATSSMELGIDVGEVDLVAQIGCPLTVSAALQRLGRAGHNPGRTSEMRIIPKTASDGLYCGFTAMEALEGGIERCHPPRLCLDVLAQQLVSMAADGSYTVDEALEIAHGAWPTREVTREDITSLLEMLSGDWEHAREKPVRPRLVYNRLLGTVTGDNYTRMLALSAGGTIPDRGLYPACLTTGQRVGELDEEFVFEARIGDRFLLGAFAWRIDQIQRDRVIVSPASTGGAQIPFWRGDGTGRDYQVSLRFGRRLRELERWPDRALSELCMDDNARENAHRFLKSQLSATGCLPTDQMILVEHFRDEAGADQMMVHSVFGGRVNAPLSMLLELAARRRTGADVRSYSDDNGALLYPIGGKELPEKLILDIDPDTAEEILKALLPSTSLFFMAFRYNASRALLMGARSGQRQALWIQRLRGAEALEIAVGDTSHPLVRETLRECLEDYMDLPALREVLRGIHSGKIALREIHVERPSPMSLPMRRQVEAEMMYDYAPLPASAIRASEAALMGVKDLKDLKGLEGIKPDAGILKGQQTKLPTPESAERLHDELMSGGDAAAGEIFAPFAWYDALLRAGRVRYIEPGLWIASEEEELYARALSGADPEALKRILRREVRFRFERDAHSLAYRYALSEELIRQVLEELLQDGALRELNGLYYHKDAYARAQRETIQVRRREAVTLPSERYAALLAQGLNRPGGTVEEALTPLLGYLAPLSAWEGVLLPGRVPNYRARDLDEWIARGEVCWQLQPDANMLSFFRAEDVDWDASPVYKTLPQGALDSEEIRVLEALERRGASFAASLSPLVERRPVIDLLEGLAQRGLVRADSFQPVRSLLSGRDRRNMPPRQLASMRARDVGAGRWELARPICQMPVEELVQRDLDTIRVLSRETAMRVSWGSALERLREWEFTGKARRGAFIAGLSPIQFIREEAYPSVMRGLMDASERAVWLHAVDPMQAWGHMLRHQAGSEFLLVGGTAVCLVGGVPAMVLEKGGAEARILDASRAEAAIAALPGDFLLGHIYSGAKRLVLKRGLEEYKTCLREAGFLPDGLNWVLWREERY